MLIFSHIRVLSVNTLREAIRQRLFHLVLLLGTAMVLGSLMLRDFDFGRDELRFLTDFNLGVIMLFGTMLAIGLTAQLFFNDLDQRLTLMILTRPVSILEFILGKFLGCCMLLFGYLVILLALLMAIVSWQETTLLRAEAPHLLSYREYAYQGLLLYGFLQWLRLCLIAALTLLFCSFAGSSVYAITVSFFTYLICQLQHLAEEKWPSAGSPILRGLFWWISRMFPNFQVLNIGDGIAAGLLPSPTAYVSAMFYALFYIFVFLSLTFFCVRKREF